MLGKAVFMTLTYYDVLDYPMTEFEVWKHLIAPREEGFRETYSLSEVLEALESLSRERRIIAFRGFYVLPGRETLVQARIHDEKRSVEKIKRASRLMQRLSWLPFVRMVGLTGSLSMKKGDADSDWDMFVVLKQGAIWRGRTVLTGMLHLLGKRRHGKKIRNRACLNCYVTDEHLELSMKDLFSAHEYRFMLPFFGIETARRFELANRWIGEMKPLYQPSELPVVWCVRPGRVRLSLQRFLETLLSSEALERMLGEWQRKKIERNPKSALPGSYIEATDETLIFLPHPKGPIIFERFKERLSHFAR